MKWYGKYGRKVSGIVIKYGQNGRKDQLAFLPYCPYLITIRLVKWYGKYWRKVSWNVKWYGKYGRITSRIVIRYGQYERQLWNDMENME